MLVAAQMALVVVLLTGAGLLLRSFVELQHVRLGFQPDHLLTMRLQLPFAKYKEDAQVIAFYDALIERVQALPGVRGTAAISDIFLTSTPNSTTVTVEGVPMTRELADEEVPLDAVTPDYFRVMGIRLIAGRTFTPRDRAGMPGVVIVNEHFARRFWPNESAVGKRFHYGSAEADTTKTPWLTVVGVVADMRRTGFDAPVRNESYLPLAQRATWRMTLVVRTATEPLALASAVRGAVRAVDHDQPVFDVQSMDQRLAGMVAQRRFSMALLGTFAALALVLAVVGVYGVTAYVVAQRTREIGLRLALGAQPETVVRMVVRQGMRVSAVGIAVGFAAALALTRLMASLLYGVSATDAMTFASVLATLALVTLLANWLPARRAARVDPVVALREE
jgi:putative ABC transport system permease protein